MAENTADTDHAARIVAFLDDWRNGDVVWFANGEDVAPLTISDLRAAMDDLKQLRAEREPRRVVCPACQRPTKLTARGLIHYHGPHNRPCRGSGIAPEIKADGRPQQPEDGAQ